MYLAIIRLKDGTERAIVYKTVRAAEKDAAKNGAVILSVSKSTA